MRFENIVCEKKGENAGGQHVLSFHNAFYPIKHKFNVLCNMTSVV